MSDNGTLLDKAMMFTCEAVFWGVLAAFWIAAIVGAGFGIRALIVAVASSARRRGAP